ncbi:MAG: squalene/phytoene synthase family protein [Alphaproteobacteria bacterium]|nr:squalene/phytoene synthase family protein [Alphaproteobacteria bacterium]
MDAALANRLAASVRAADPDRYFSALFAPGRERPFLFALYAFNAEVSRIAETVREPMLGAIKLEWWRETAEGAAKGSPRNHDAARGLAALFAERDVALADLEAIIATRAFDSSAEQLADFAALESYVDATSGAVMRLAARILGGDPQIVREAGLAYGLAGLVRALPFHNSRHKLYLPLDLLTAPRLVAAARQVGLKARDHFFAARAAPKPRQALAAILPAALVPVYLRKLAREVPIHRRQMALLSAAMKKRL